MPAELPVPEIQPILDPNITAFRGQAFDLIDYFNAAHGYTDGRRTPDGVISDESLEEALSDLTSRAMEDPSVAALMGVASAAQTEMSRAEEPLPNWQQLERGPVMGLLSLAGAARPIERPVLTGAAPEVSAPATTRYRRMGYPVLVDGQVVSDGE